MDAADHDQAVERETVRAAAEEVIDQEWAALVAFFLSAPPEKLAALLRVLRIGDLPRLVERIRELPDADLQVLAWFARLGLMEAALRADAAECDGELPEV